MSLGFPFIFAILLKTALASSNFFYDTRNLGDSGKKDKQTAPKVDKITLGI